MQHIFIQKQNYYPKVTILKLLSLDRFTNSWRHQKGLGICGLFPAIFIRLGIETEKCSNSHILNNFTATRNVCMLSDVFYEKLCFQNNDKRISEKRCSVSHFANLFNIQSSGDSWSPALLLHSVCCAAMHHPASGQSHHTKIFRIIIKILLTSWILWKRFPDDTLKDTALK